METAAAISNKENVGAGSFMAGGQRQRAGGRRQHGKHLGGALNLAQVSGAVDLAPDAEEDHSDHAAHDGQSRPRSSKLPSSSRQTGKPPGHAAKSIMATARSRPNDQRAETSPVARLPTKPMKGEIIVIVRKTLRSKPRSSRTDWPKSDIPDVTSK